jgi:hypothetical protein
VPKTKKINAHSYNNTHRHSHVGSLLFHQQYKLSVAGNVFNLVNVGWNCLTTNTHFGTIDKVSIFFKLNPSHHETLVTGHNVKIRSSAPNHGGHIIEDSVGITLIDKEFHVRVKQIPFGNVNSFHQDGVQELQHS